jgi:light-regulated signal transduction histidine kinase (bacteriophytochrome)
MEKRELDLHELIDTVIRDQVSEDRKEQISVDIDPDVKIMADAPMLKVVLHNLLSNSLKFTRTQQRPRIIIGHRREGERDILFVRDNGVGFDARHKDKAFGVFKRLHGSDQFEGTGVGLAIVHRIVSKHGGEAWAESAVGAGATISIALPRHGSSKEFAPFIKVA